MQKKELPVYEKSRELKKIKNVSKTAKALLMVVLFAAVFLIGPTVLAQSLALNAEFAELSGLPSASLGVIVARIINAALGLLGLVAVIILLYAGFLYMTAKGEAEKVQKAKKLLIEAGIGLLIIVLSFAIAQFIFWALGINAWGGGDGGGGGGIPGGGGGGGALGAGIIRSHYPARNAKEVPRNTKIAITFKEPICLESIINDTNNSGVFGDCIDAIDANENGKFDVVSTSESECDLINPATIKIRKNDDTASAGPFVDLVSIFPTADNKTFTMKPVAYLGNDQTPTWYVVQLTNDLKKADCSELAFGGFGGYNWKFEVSTELDLRQPQIKSVIPRATKVPGTVFMNTVIQINFDEAIDPTTLAGKLQIEEDEKVGPLKATSYNLMTVKVAGTDNYVAGEFYFSNQYRTVEFITNDPCGINSCGNEIYCLPPLSDISVLINSATLDESGKPTAQEQPALLGTMGVLYDGIVDMCSNSLDGNLDELPQGPQSQSGYDPYYLNDPDAVEHGDDATWIFNTNDRVDLTPPQIEDRIPSIGEADVNPDNDLKLDFDKIISPNSLMYNNAIILDQPGAAVISGYDFSIENNAEKTKSTITILTFKGLNNNQVHNLIANQYISDLTQNCYLPCSDYENCVRFRDVTDPEGQYRQGDPWVSSVIYPTCDLSTTP